MHAHAFLEPLLLYIVFPVWLLAGFADSLCHRAQRIELTAGWRESALHWLMLIELGIGVSAILLLELNAFVIALFAAVCILHELTLAVDLLYANSRRRVPAVEQWVHGVQQAIPWIVLLIISAMRPAQALAVVGLGEARGDWAWKPRIAPAEPSYLVAFAAAAALLVGLPFALEAWRAFSRRQQGLLARPAA